jgi:hypothetical protein
VERGGGIKGGRGEVSVKKSEEVRKIVNSETITDKDRDKAQQCLECSLCKHARKKQKGIAFWLVKVVEDSLCPYCKAYEKVYGHKAHEPISEQ